MSGEIFGSFEFSRVDKCMYLRKCTSLELLSTEILPMSLILCKVEGNTYFLIRYSNVVVS